MAHPGRHAEQNPDAVALINADTGTTLTWAELHQRSVTAANHFHDLGLRQGDSLAFCLENRFDFVTTLWGATYCGLRFTPISTRLTRDEVGYIIGDCEARVVLYSQRTAAAVEAATGAVDGVVAIDVDDPQSWSTTAAQPARFERAEGVPMLYSSGTTGQPKGVWRPAPDAPIEELQPADQALAGAFQIDASSVYLSTAPLYHSAPITFLIRMGRLGATTVIMDRFDPAESLAHIERFGVTHSQWVPTMFVRLLRLDPAVRARHDLSTHRVAVHGAAPCPVHVKAAMMDWWGPVLYEYYAGTEGVGTCLIGPEEWLTHPGSVGRSVSGPIHILHGDAGRLPPGEVGEIWFERGGDFHYLNDEEKTSGSRRPGGSATFGDLGYLDDEGYLYLTDRKAFTIISGGVNVYPQEVEDVLLTHPSVHDAAVFGLPDPEYGEVVTAVIDPDPEASTDGILVDQLLEHCRQNLADYKCPRSIHFATDFPREPNGKLMKRQLRERYTTTG